MKSWILLSTCSLGLALLTLGCGSDGGDDTSNPSSKGSVDLDAFNTDGKGDLAKSTKLLDSVPPDAKIKGKFDPRARTYGYVVEARKGATLTFNLEATAGKDAEGVTPGSDLDMVYEVLGPFTSTKNPGEKLLTADDTSETDLSAPSTTLKVEQDGKYFIAFTSFNDTGKGDYSLDISCEGTSVQCLRPDFSKPCKKGKTFIQGAVIDDNQSWDTCEVVILEDVTIQKDATVTIKPGVEVKGNFLGAAPFGTVHLNVEGLLQAVGTQKDPIVFTNFVEEQGWGGLTFSSRENLLEHVFIINAQVGARVASSASVSINHAVIEGKSDSRNGTIGLSVLAEGDADLKHALIKQFATGVDVNQSLLVSLTESVVRDNNVGINVTGSGRTRNRCNVNVPVTPSPRPFDPKITNTDIIHNAQVGVRMLADNVFIQIENSNIADNGGHGVLFWGSQLHEESFIRNSNIIRNNGATDEVSTLQVESFHTEGTFDVTGNYWGFISDPNLGATRGGGCNEPLVFTGFSPELIATAGPTPKDLTAPVQQETFQVEQAGR